MGREVEALPPLPLLSTDTYTTDSDTADSYPRERGMLSDRAVYSDTSDRVLLSDRAVLSTEGVEITGLTAPDGATTLGFRAEDASVVAGSGQINAPIYTQELLGDSTMVSVRIGGALISVKADKTYQAKIGDLVSINVPTDACHLFSTSTGIRIDV